ncbi:hypothetical protein TRFO_19928 [Tritrichomonas foetus]|uniref:RING-type domain-containing protein n=1 Tax=Tritrichomonas foetus TaxID=1144522 RepID=A0A1J4KLZ0_9EUKA|nr:hypothetical protein TRFO_19928 [Tritrichomonas foetus]|eukprot:OHT10710.1 hypothetical protein TRFO_19928 [Tritrichomonas foetus]
MNMIENIGKVFFIAVIVKFPMNRDSLDNFDYHLKSEILAAATSSKHVWAILSDSNLHIINKSNPRNFICKPIQISGKQSLNSTCKIYVSPDENNCMIITPGFLYYYSLRNPDEAPKKLILPQSGECKCGSWFEEDGYPYFIYCTSNGEVFQLSPDSTKISNHLYSMKNKTPIYNILILNTNITYVFLFVSDHILCFFGDEPLAILFCRGPSNKVIMVGPSNTTTLDRSCKFNNQISITCAFGILTLFDFELAKSQIKYKQTVTDYNAQEIIAFTFCQYGALIAKKDKVEFISNKQTNPTKFSLNLPDVIKIVVDENHVWFITQRRFFNISLRKFLDLASEIALENKDYEFALQTSNNSNTRIIAIKHQMEVMKPPEMAKFLFSLNWPMQFIANIFIDSPKFLIQYFELILNKNCNFSIQLAHWTLILYSQIYPDSKNDFLVFIERHYSKFSRNAILQVLEKVSFWEGIEKYLYLINDIETLINMSALYQKYDSMLSILLKTENPTQFVNITLKLLNINPNQTDELFATILQTKPFTPDKIVPLLCISPNFAIQYLQTYFFKKNDIYSSILVMAYCENNTEYKIIKMVKDSLIDPCRALRFCLQSNCINAATEILWSLAKPELAIDHAIDYSIKYNLPELEEEVKKLVREEKKLDIQKRGWKRLLQKTNGNKRREIMAEVLDTNLFNFEEITNYVDDMDTIRQYKDIMLEAVNMIQEAAAPVHYRTKFAPVFIPDKLIKLTDRCVLCGTSIIGQKFVIFPCQHMAHSECLKENTQRLRKYMKTEFHDQYLRSCPVCGFASIPETSGINCD